MVLYLLNEVFLSLKLLPHFRIRYLEDTELVIFLFEHVLDGLDLLLEILLYPKLNEGVLVEKAVEFIVRAALPHLDKVLPLVLLPLNLLIFREEPLEVRHLPQFVLLLLHQGLRLVFRVVDEGFVMVHLRMQTPDGVCLLLDLLLLSIELNFHALEIPCHLCILLSEPDDLDLQLGLLLSYLSKFDG